MCYSATWKLGEAEKKIILVGHSFGGVIIKALVTEVQSLILKEVLNEIDRENVMKCKKFLEILALVIFYSVPHAPTHTEFENFILGCSNTRVFQRNSLLKSLADRRDDLFIPKMIELSRNFERAISHQTKVLAFLEGKPMSKVMHISSLVENHQTVSRSFEFCLYSLVMYAVIIGWLAFGTSLLYWIMYNVTLHRKVQSCSCSVPRFTNFFTFYDRFSSIELPAQKRLLVSKESCEGQSLSWEWHKVDKDNHFEVCRPDSKSHAGYKILLNHLKQLIRPSDTTAPTNVRFFVDIQNDEVLFRASSTCVNEIPQHHPDSEVGFST